MRIYGVGEVDVLRAVRRVSLARYEGNIRVRASRDLSSARRAAAVFTIRVTDSRGRGARRSASGRRMPAACWHAHYDVLAELLWRYPNARIVTHLAAYDATNFRGLAWATGDVNMGSLCAPARLRDLCDCDASGWVPSVRRRCGRADRAAT